MRAGYVYILMASFGTPRACSTRLRPGRTATTVSPPCETIRRRRLRAGLVLGLVLLRRGLKAGLVPLTVWAAARSSGGAEPCLPRW